MDVAIIGAGPAGAWAAYCLAARGARVTIFDGSHPREKPCGGGVTGRALARIRAALPETAVPVQAITAARFVQPHGPDARVPLTQGSLLVASRRAFDQALLTAALDAGATLVTSRVTDVETVTTGVRITTLEGVHDTPFLIGADGANSLVRRRLSRPFARGELSIATGFFAPGVTADEIAIELTSDPPGYLWSFPRPDHMAIGICAQADAGASAQRLRASCAEWSTRAGIAPGATLVPYSWPIPSLGERELRAQRLAGDVWCLIGDAAGLVDPLTREGISFALESAEHAAVACSGFDAARIYTARIQDGIGAELGLAARFKRRFFRPEFSGLLLRALRESEGVRRIMADLVGGTQSYRTLKWRLLQTLEFGLAWRTLRMLAARA